MKKSKELLTNTLIIGIGQFSTKLIGFLLLPIYTSYLSTYDYGIYDILLTITIFIVPIITMLMEESMFRFLIDCKNNDEKGIVVSQSIIYIIISSFIFILIYLLIGIFINIPFNWIFLLYILTSVLVTTQNALARGFSKIKLYSITNFFASFIVIILNILFIIYLKLGIKSLLLSFVIGNTFISSILFFVLKTYKFISFKNLRKAKLKEMFNYSYPLVPNSVSWTIINLSDRVVVTGFIGANANGIYSMAYKFPTLMDTVYSFFYTAWKESASKTVNQKDSKTFYNNIYNVLNKVMFSIVLLIISFLPIFFNLLIKKQFRLSYVYIPILIISMFFSNMSGFFGGIFSAYKDTKVMGKSTIIGAIINLLVDIIFIKFIGIWAAAISTLLSTVFVYEYRKHKLKKYVILNSSGNNYFLSLFVLLISLVVYYICNFYFCLIWSIIVFFICFYINIDVIKIFYNTIIKKKKAN